MAKFEYKFRGDFDEILSKLENGIFCGSCSATLEDKSDYKKGDYRCAVRIFERYSMAGSSRVSLSITLVGVDDELFISVITSGGSQALFFKVNTFGEKTFLKQAQEIVENYINKNR